MRRLARGGPAVFGWVCRTMVAAAECMVGGDTATAGQAEREWTGHYYRTHYVPPARSNVRHGA